MAFFVINVWLLFYEGGGVAVVVIVDVVVRCPSPLFGGLETGLVAMTVVLGARGV